MSTLVIIGAREYKGLQGVIAENLTLEYFRKIRRDGE
jgi:hypothetical protein